MLSDCSRFVVNDVQQKINGIQNKGTGSAGVTDQMALHEIKDRMNNVGNDVKALLGRPQVSQQAVAV